MGTAKSEVQARIDGPPDDCTLDDVQYHLHVIEKIRRGIDRAEGEGMIPQEDVEKRLSRWTEDRQQQGPAI